MATNKHAQSQSMVSGARVSELPVEAIVASTSGKARISEEPVEVILSSTSGKAHISELPIEVIAQVIHVGFGQANAYIKLVQFMSGQAQARIECKDGFQDNAFQDDAFQECITTATSQGGQVQGYIRAPIRNSAQAQADLKQSYTQSAQAQADIKATYTQSGQSRAAVKETYSESAQAQADIKAVGQSYGQANAQLLGAIQRFAQSQADIKQKNQAYGQSRADIKTVNRVSAQAQAYVVLTGFGSGQAQATIKGNAFGQAQGHIKSTGRAHGQAQADVKTTTSKFGQAQASINRHQGYGQARASISGDFYLRDTFTRTQSLGTVGQPDIGPTWVAQTPGDLQYAQVDGTRFFLDSSLAAYVWTAAKSDIAKSNVDVYVEFVISDPTKNYVEIDAKIGAASVYCWINTLGTWTLQSSGSLGSTSASYPLTAGVTYAVRFQVRGSVAKFKIWPTSQSQPIAWLITKIDVDTLASSTGFWVDAEQQGSSDLYVDNFFAVAPYEQAFGQAQAFVTYRGYGLGQAQTEIVHLDKERFAQANAQIVREWPVILYDTFTRTVAAGSSPGTPDIGGPYDYTLATGSSIDGSEFVRTGSFDWLEWDAPRLTDTEIRFDFEGTTYAGIFDVYIHINDPVTYRAYIEIRQFNTGVYIFWSRNFDEEWIHTDYAFNTNTWYSVKIRAEGELISVKVWERAQSEPNDWLVQAEPVNPIYQGITNGAFVIGLASSGGGPSYLDNYLVSGIYLIKSGQAQASIINTTPNAQAQAHISTPTPSAQAQAFVGHFQFAQAQAYIIGYTNNFVDAQTYNLSNKTISWYNDFSQWTWETYDPDPFSTTFLSQFDYWPSRYANFNTHPVPGDAPTAWLKFTLDVSSIVSIDTLQYFDNDHDTIFAVYTGDSGPPTSWTRLFFNDDVSGIPGFESQGGGVLPAGTYLLLMGFYDYATPLNVTTNFSAVPGNQTYGQARAVIRRPIVYGQAKADILQTQRKFAQAKADIKAVSQQFAQAQTYIRPLAGSGQTQAQINAFNVKGYGQAMAQTTVTTPQAQAQADIRRAYKNSAQALGYIERIIIWAAQAQATISSKPYESAQAQAWITRTQGYGQAQAYVLKHWVSGQAQAKLIGRGQGHGQAVAYISTTRISALAQATILRSLFVGQAQGSIFRQNRRYQHGQAQASIVIPVQTNSGGQAAGLIIHAQGYGQASAKIKGQQNGIGQANCLIFRRDTRFQSGQARAVIFTGAHIGQANAMITPIDYTVPGGGGLGGGILLAPSYPVNFNAYTLPGYAQSEQFDSSESTDSYPAAYEDTSLIEYLGLRNKTIGVRMKVVGDDYISVKSQVRKAATVVRSSIGFKKLYLGRTDAYYEAMTQSIAFEKAATESQRVGDYTVQWNAKPWLISDREYQISGTGTITTDQVLRTGLDGGWSPVSLELSGTNITVSGYTSHGDFAGYVTVSGAVSNLQIDTDRYITSIPNVLNLDYRLYVGPGKTSFTITGASSCIIRYRNRWYL